MKMICQHFVKFPHLLFILQKLLFVGIGQDYSLFLELLSGQFYFLKDSVIFGLD